LWVSNGTAAGTRLFFDFCPEHCPSHTVPLARLGRRTFIALLPLVAPGTRSLWVTDGTSRGTVPLVSIGPGGMSTAELSNTVVGNRLFFRGHDEEHGFELWVSDGTSPGTHLVRDIAP
jgi:ELWxxDGT repeat protein